MVPDRQKVRMDKRTDRWTDRRRQNYIPMTSSGDNKGLKNRQNKGLKDKWSLMKVESIAESYFLPTLSDNLS